MNKFYCTFEKCGGELKPKDNGKTPIGLFECNKCKSMFRMTLVANNFDTKYNTKVIPFKELKVKK